MAKKPLHVAILWHMHQPDYSDAQTGEIYLPWTRFHAVKDYYDMASLAAETLGLHLTINVVPSLLDQLIAYSHGKVREACATVSLKNAAQLDEREKAFILRTFFQLSLKHMVNPYPRYRELLDRRGAADSGGEFPVGLQQYSTQDYRDLQTWYNLAWCGSELRRNPEITAFFRKGRAFTEQDKKRLLEIQFSFVGRILPYYRDLMEKHGIKLSVSPYYHPILPLLCDIRSAREALPAVPLPKEPFAYPVDAREHIVRAQQRFAEIFGRMPPGMWPSEGSLSDAALALARSADLRWLASDDGVLLQSLQKLGRAGRALSPEQKYCAYRWGDGDAGPCLFFRDHQLSDLIGFTYSTWRADDAAADFLRRLQLIHRSLPENGRTYIVPVILDGENAWEHYPENGGEFLRQLYRGMKESPELRSVTFSEFLDLERYREPLPSLLAGSWIYGNFSTWVGHPEKNRAWEFLALARRCLASYGREIPPKQMELAEREMMIAEGSDWFWWFGDDHETENAAEFDALFRGHVKNVYRLLGKAYPTELDTPIKRVGVRTQCRNPVHTMTPRLDGRVTDYFEWLSAGFAKPGAGESMHRTQRHLDKLFFGYDVRNFYLRLDLAFLGHGTSPSGISLRVQFVSPAECSLLLAPDESGKWQGTITRSAVPHASAEVAADRIIELGIPLDALGIRSSSEVRFCVSVLEGDHEVERFPSSAFLAVPVDPWGLDEREWIV